MTGFRYDLRHPTRWYDDAAKWLREDTLRDGFELYCAVESEDSAVAGGSPASSKGKSVAR